MTIIGATWLRNRIRKPRKPLMKQYQERNDRLSELGISYQEYLKTPEWADIRKKVLLLRPNCLICANKANQIHHTDYDWETLLGTNLIALASLCEKCHKYIEFDEKGNKHPLYLANRTLRKAIQQVGTDEAKIWENENAAWVMNAAKRRRNLENNQERREDINRNKREEIKRKKQKDKQKKKAEKKAGLK